MKLRDDALFSLSFHHSLDDFTGVIGGPILKKCHLLFDLRFSIWDFRSDRIENRQSKI